MAQTQNQSRLTDNTYERRQQEFPLVPEEDFIELIASSTTGYDFSTLLDKPPDPAQDSESTSNDFQLFASSRVASVANLVSDDNFQDLISTGVAYDPWNSFLDVEKSCSVFDMSNYEPEELFSIDPPMITREEARQLEISNGIFNSDQATSLTTQPSNQGDLTHVEAVAHASFSPLSMFNSPASFMSAGTPASYMTARSNFNSPAFSTQALSPEMTQALGTILESVPEYVSPRSILPDQRLPLGTSRLLEKLSNEYRKTLEQKKLLLPPDAEINWSGRGQHVEYLPNEEVPLQVLSHLGSSVSATVDRVQCKRIALARKMMRCTRTWKAEDALREVEHLHKLRHFHIVQLVGSYLQGRTFSILMYPAADCHLGTFMEDTADLANGDEVKLRHSFLASTLSCLSSAVAFIHVNTTKHMDIKPMNILIRNVALVEKHCWPWKVYLADFGLSKSFASQDHSQTDGPTARTPKYCAPEVYDYESRGRSADIFSLGCVFLEILTVIQGKSLDEFAEFRRGHDSQDESFRANLPRVLQWKNYLSSWTFHRFLDRTLWPPVRLFNIVWQMMAYDQSERPSSYSLKQFFLNSGPGSPFFGPESLFLGSPSCCSAGPEPYVANI